MRRSTIKNSKEQPKDYNDESLISQCLTLVCFSFLFLFLFPSSLSFFRSPLWGMGWVFVPILDHLPRNGGCGNGLAVGYSIVLTGHSAFNAKRLLAYECN